MSYRVRLIAASLILLISGFLMAAPASAAGLIVDAGAPNGSDDTATLQGILDAGDVLFWWSAGELRRMYLGR